MTTSIYKSTEGETKILELYDRFQEGLGLAFEDRMVDTRFGATHVLVTGPAQGAPLVITHGGNSINPQGLRGLLPLLKQQRYRVYAPDTIGHPGKSAQVRLSARDQSYGQWLSDVLDGLGLDKAAFVGGSFGAGIILRLAAHAPQRIAKMALFVPAGIVPVPMTSMLFRIGLPYLSYLLFPGRRRLRRAVGWMGDEVEDDFLELIEAIFQHVRLEAEMPRPAAQAELVDLAAPVLVIAAEKDVMFPGEAVVKRAREIVPNLAGAECLAGGTHYSSQDDLTYVNRRIVEFLEMYHLVHANVARLRAPLDDPLLADFVARVDEIDALAQACPGYVSQPTPANEGAVYAEPLLLNLSIWESVETLERFTYGGEHGLMLERRAEWFHQDAGPNYVLFWFPAGQIPTEREVEVRLEHLAASGATPYAFTFDQRFTVREMLDYVENGCVCRPGRGI
jgi:pimeloyl-ACP methyl ester carboxylesterase